MNAPAPTELLPCPFCTSETVQCCFGLGATYVVECQSCETSGPRAMDRQTAISAWNTRQAASVGAGVAGLRASNEQRGNDLVTVIAQRDAAEKALRQVGAEVAGEAEAESYERGFQAGYQCALASPSRSEGVSKGEVQSAREAALEAAALDFIAKVDRGEARSTKSYAAFKAALSVAQEAKHCGADAMISEIEKRFPDWKGFRDLVDCIDVTLHRLRGGS